jgi:hypothetical protein
MKAKNKNQLDSIYHDSRINRKKYQTLLNNTRRLSSSWAIERNSLILKNKKLQQAISSERERRDKFWRDLITRNGGLEIKDEKDRAIILKFFEVKSK